MRYLAPQLVSSESSFLVFFKQKTAYEMRISDWSSDVCSSDLSGETGTERNLFGADRRRHRTHSPARGSEPPCRIFGSARRHQEIGRASCRERVCQYV